MKKAFTLAEVLITLGIIGVIAALTLPGLIQGYRKKVTETALKKAYTQLYQALEQAQTDNGEAINWNWEDYQTYDRDSAEAFLQEYFYPYFNIIGRSAVQQHKDKLKYVIYNYNDDYSQEPNWFWNNPQLTNWAELSDGNVISFVLKNTNPNTGAFGQFNVILSSNKNPKRLISGKDVFAFYLKKHPYNSQVSISPDGWQNSNCQELKNNRNDFINGCKGESVNASGIISSIYCTSLIYCNNWKIPKDYPIRF